MLHFSCMCYGEINKKILVLPLHEILPLVSGLYFKSALILQYVTVSKISNDQAGVLQ